MYPTLLGWIIHPWAAGAARGISGGRYRAAVADPDRQEDIGSGLLAVKPHHAQMDHHSWDRIRALPHYHARTRPQNSYRGPEPHPENLANTF